MGAKNIDEYLPGENSLFVVNNFEDQRSVAKHISLVDSSHKFYLTFFDWKNTVNDNFVAFYDQCKFQMSSLCSVCLEVSSYRSKLSNNLHSMKKKNHEGEPILFSF